MLIKHTYKWKLNFNIDEGYEFYYDSVRDQSLIITKNKRIYFQKVNLHIPESPVDIHGRNTHPAIIHNDGTYEWYENGIFIKKVINELVCNNCGDFCKQSCF